VITAELLRTIAENYPRPLDGVHGLDHWARVLENGRKLAAVTGADIRVVELFSIFHDSCRFNDHIDPGHGRRGGLLATELRGKLFDLDDHAFDLLFTACELHTDGLTEGDITLCTCWDADRLDLSRALIVPLPDRLATEAAKDPALMKWADSRAHDHVVPDLIHDIWLPMLDGLGEGLYDH